MTGVCGTCAAAEHIVGVVLRLHDDDNYHAVCDGYKKGSAQVRSVKGPIFFLDNSPTFQLIFPFARRIEMFMRLQRVHTQLLV